MYVIFRCAMFLPNSFLSRVVYKIKLQLHLGKTTGDCDCVQSREYLTIEAPCERKWASGSGLL